MPLRVFIARPIQPSIIKQVAQSCEVEVHPGDAPIAPPQFANAIASMDRVVSAGGNISEDVLGSAAKLRVVAHTGAGYDAIDLAACTKRGIAVTSTLTEWTADFAFGLLLAVSRLFKADRNVRAGEWKIGVFDLL